MTVPKTGISQDNFYLPKEKGIYVVHLSVRKPAKPLVGRNGSQGYLDLSQGDYLYVGSATGAGGISARVSRHIRKLGDNKKAGWHLDYIRDHGCVERIWFGELPADAEHDLALTLSRLPGGSAPFPGIGGTDCKGAKKKCPAHFLKVERRLPLSLLRNIGDFNKLVATEVEPRTRNLKSVLEWEPDYWAGQRVLEKVRLECYRQGLPCPDKIASLGGNPVLRKAIAGPDSKRILKQVKFAHAVDSMIECHGEEAYEVIFDAAKPQTRKDILQISRKSRERQFDRITMVSCWDEKSIGPQKGDIAPDTMTFGKILSRIGRAKGPLRGACETLKPQLHRLDGHARSSIKESLKGYRKLVPELSRLIRPMETVCADGKPPVRKSEPENKQSLERLHVGVASGLSMLKKTVRDIPRSSYDLRPNAEQKTRALKQLKLTTAFMRELANEMSI